MSDPNPEMSVTLSEREWLHIRIYLSQAAQRHDSLYARSNLFSDTATFHKDSAAESRSLARKIGAQNDAALSASSAPQAIPSVGLERNNDPEVQEIEDSFI